jgi:hypothetical protein
MKTKTLLEKPTIRLICPLRCAPESGRPRVLLSVALRPRLRRVGLRGCLASSNPRGRSILRRSPVTLRPEGEARENALMSDIRKLGSNSGSVAILELPYE